MATVKEKMLQARSLIQQKKYAEARKILKTVNHPTAQEWLTKLDRLAPPPKRSRLPLILGGLLLVVLIAAAAVLLLPRLTGGGLLGGLTGGGAASAPGAALARYFPADALFYASLRSDEAYIAQLDGLVSRVVASLPPGTVPIGASFSLQTLLDQAAQQAGAADFATAVRPWLGDAIALGAYNPPVTPESGYTGPALLVAVAIRDQAAAVSFIESALPAGSFTRSDESGYVVFTSGLGAEALAVGTEVLLFGGSRAALPLAALPSPDLSASAAYSAALGALPASSYNLTVFVDTASLIDLAGELAQGPAASALAFNVGATAIGATILNDNTLTLDAAQLASADGPALPAPGRIDPAFEAFIPASAALTIHGTNLKALYDGVIAAARDSAAAAGADAAQIEAGLAGLEAQISQFTGLSLQNDILSWLTGDFAVYIGPNPASPLGVDLGLVIKATDPAQAANVVDKLAAALDPLMQAQGMSLLREPIGGADAILIPAGPMLPVDVVIAANGSVFAAGTRPSVDDSLAGINGLGASTVYEAARGVLLPGPSSVWFVDMIALGQLGQTLASAAGAPDPALTDQANALAGLFTHATASTASAAGGVTLLRLTLTLTP